ncbi:MAG: HD domain-containing phosphohydrolase [Peptococcia bacterium]
MKNLIDWLQKNYKSSENIINYWHEPKGKRKYFVIFTIAILLILIGYIMYMAGGAMSALAHMMYFPIILGAFCYHIPGGLICGILAGLILGPVMGLLGADYQLTSNWIIRILFYTFTGGFIGFLFELLKERTTTISNILKQLSSTYTQTLKSFASIVTGRDEQTGGHCERVALNACIIGKAMQLNDRFIEALYWAGLLHDLGKIAIPEHVLLKPGALNEEEMEIIRKHSQIGSEIIEVISPEFEQIAQGIASHHERWDGMGYPNGLKGEEIPLIGRILAIVDVFEALSSKRPYRDPVGTEEALKYIQDNSGTHFDPHIVEIFTDLYKQEQIFIQGAEETIVMEFQSKLDLFCHNK